MSDRTRLITRDTGLPICPHCGFARLHTDSCKRPGTRTVVCRKCKAQYVVVAYPVMRYDTEPVRREGNRT